MGTATDERREIRKPLAAARPAGTNQPGDHRRAPVRRSRHRLVIVVAAAALVAAAVAGWWAWGRGSTATAPVLSTVPLSYHIEYSVSSGNLTDRESLWVQRPFEAEDVLYDAHGAVTSTVVTRLGRQLIHAAGGSAGVLQVPPGPSPFDVRLDASLPAALRSGLVSARGRMVIAGRPCRVYRGAQAFDSPTFGGRPTAADHVDTCLDDHGLVLDELHVAGGKVARDRRAVAVDDSANAVAGHQFATSGTHVPLSQGGGEIYTITSTSRPPGVDFWEPDRAPDGFTHFGRFAVVPPQPKGDASQEPAPLVTAIDDVYVRGADLIVIEQGEAVGGAPFAAPTGGLPVDLGDLGKGTLSPSPQASSVTALAANATSFVRVNGTVPAPELVAVARSLHRLPAGTIVTAPELTSDGA